MPEGTPIIAARSGVVVKTENEQAGRGNDPSGNFVRVQHDDGTEGAYLHLKQGSVSVRVGQRVAVGSPLALSGNTGNSSGPHLHFVVQRATEAGLVSIPYEFNQPVAHCPTLRWAIEGQSSIKTLASTIFGPFIFLMMIRRPSTSSTSSSSGTRFRVS